MSLLITEQQMLLETVSDLAEKHSTRGLLVDGPKTGAMFERNDATVFQGIAAIVD